MAIVLFLLPVPARTDCAEATRLSSWKKVDREVTDTHGSHLYVAAEGSALV